MIPVASEIPLSAVFALSAALFTLGVVGALLRRNLLAVLISLELMLNAVNLAWIGFDRHRAAVDGALRVEGQIFALFVVAIGVAQLAVGLGILAALLRNRDSLDVDDASLLKW